LDIKLEHLVNNIFIKYCLCDYRFKRIYHLFIDHLDDINNIFLIVIYKLHDSYDIIMKIIDKVSLDIKFEIIKRKEKILDSNIHDIIYNKFFKDDNLCEIFHIIPNMSDLTYLHDLKSSEIIKFPVVYYTFCNNIKDMIKVLYFCWNDKVNMEISLYCNNILNSITIKKELTVELFQYLVDRLENNTLLIYNEKELKYDHNFIIYAIEKKKIYYNDNITLKELFFLYQDKHDNKSLISIIKSLIQNKYCNLTLYEIIDIYVPSNVHFNMEYIINDFH